MLLGGPAGAEQPRPHRRRARRFGRAMPSAPRRRPGRPPGVHLGKPTRRLGAPPARRRAALRSPGAGGDTRVPSPRDAHPPPPRRGRRDGRPWETGGQRAAWCPGALLAGGLLAQAGSLGGGSVGTGQRSPPPPAVSIPGSSPPGWDTQGVAAAIASPAWGWPGNFSSKKPFISCQPIRRVFIRLFQR